MRTTAEHPLALSRRGACLKQNKKSFRTFFFFFLPKVTLGIETHSHKLQDQVEFQFLTMESESVYFEVTVKVTKVGTKGELK